MSKLPHLPALAEALKLAERAHAGQLRKGTQIPYIAHPLAVASLVLDFGGSSDQAIAALLHDAIEDGGAAFAGEIEAQFSRHVRELVEACSDGTAEGKAKHRSPAAKLVDWRERKLGYLGRLKCESEEALLITACDKLHNVRAIVADLERIGPSVFERFTGKRDGTLWHYAQLLEILRERGSPLSEVLEKEAARMRKLANPPRNDEADEQELLHSLLDDLDAGARAKLRDLIARLQAGAQLALAQSARAMGEASAQQQRLTALEIAMGAP